MYVKVTKKNLRSKYLLRKPFTKTNPVYTISNLQTFSCVFNIDKEPDQLTRNSMCIIRSVWSRESQLNVYNIKRLSKEKKKKPCWSFLMITLASGIVPIKTPQKKSWDIAKARRAHASVVHEYCIENYNLNNTLVSLATPFTSFHQTLLA